MLVSFPSVMVHEADIAAVAVVALTEARHHGSSYELTGPDALTPAERAELIGEDLDHVKLTEAQHLSFVNLDSGYCPNFSAPDVLAAVIASFGDSA